MPVLITPEHPGAPESRALIRELEDHLESLYPRASRHGFSVERLITEGVAFFIIRDGDDPAGCGGIQIVRTEYGELKRMYVRPRYRGRGFGRLLLDHLTAYARYHEISLLRLETGIHQDAAIALYERAGFLRIPPFGNYFSDQLSRCYEKRIR